MIIAEAKKVSEVTKLAKVYATLYNGQAITLPGRAVYLKANNKIYKSYRNSLGVAVFKFFTKKAQNVKVLFLGDGTYVSPVKSVKIAFKT